jgi:tRNA pseudouridine38-40 synthase
MVRIMAGTLVEVGLGKRPAASMPDLLRRGVRSEAGTTAPAHGLLLVEVKWTR